MNSVINVVWKEGHDLSYIKVRLSKKLNDLFEEFEMLRSLHESFSTKTPPKVPVQILLKFHNLKNWKSFLVPMGLDVHAVRTERDGYFTACYYVTNVHRLDDLVTQVPKEYLTGIIEMTNDLIENLEVEGLKPYQLPFEQEEDDEEEVTEVTDEPSLEKTCFFRDVDGVEVRTSLLVGSIGLLLLVSGIVFPLLYFFGR